MWNINSGNNYVRLLDESNAMKRHYSKLKEIKKRSRRPNFYNSRYSSEKKKPKRYTKVKINRSKQILTDNKKMLNALERINERWGELGPNNFLNDQGAIKQKTLGFKKKSNQDMIKESIRYLEKIKAVKPVYNKKMFEDEEKQYLYLKKNIKVSNGNFRRMKKKSFVNNEKAVKRIKKERPKSAGFSLKGKSKAQEEGMIGKRNKSVVKLTQDKIMIIDNKQPKSRFYGLGLNRRPRSAFFHKDGRVKNTGGNWNSESQIILI